MVALDGGQDIGPTVRRMVLGTRLRRLREQADITREEAGYSIRGSASKISRVELGRVGFKERDVTDLLTLYGVVESEEREQFLTLVSQSNQPGWWYQYSDVMPRWFEDFVGLEEAAARIQTFEVQFLPGLLQTEEYARAIVNEGQPHAVDGLVERVVALRVRRQRLLEGPNAPQVWAVVDESVLHRPLGGRTVAREQLRRLLELTALPHVSLQVLPFAKSGHAATGAFTLLRFAEAELPSIAYIEHLAGALYLEKPDEIEIYGRAMDRLAVEAETPKQTRQILAKLLAEI